MKISFALRNSLLVPKVECWKWSICWTPKICSPVRKRNTNVVPIKNYYGAKSKLRKLGGQEFKFSVVFLIDLSYKPPNPFN